MADDVVALMDSLKIARADIVGWSDGGILGIDLAMRHKDRVDKIFAFAANTVETAYHGNTAAVTDVSPSSRPGQALPPHVRTVPAPEMFRCSGSDPGQRFAASVTVAIADLKRSGIRFAGLLVDTIFSSDGVYADPPGFLTAAVAAVRAHGGMFIADEVHPGIGPNSASL